MKSDFIPPAVGQVIGIHNASSLAYFMSRSRLFLAIVFMVIGLIGLGLEEEITRNDFFPLIMICAILIPSLIRMRINHHGKRVSMILTSSGVSIENSKIVLPFTRSVMNTNYGIDRFRLNGDSLILDTKKVKGRSVFVNSMEINSIEFNIPAMYLEHKDELLKYLNTLASES